MATHSSILAWRIPWTEEPGGLQSVELQKLDMNEATEGAHRQHPGWPVISLTSNCQGANKEHLRMCRSEHVRGFRDASMPFCLGPCLQSRCTSSLWASARRRGLGELAEGSKALRVAVWAG